MPTLFRITAEVNNIHLNSKRQGEVYFTVFNISDRPIRGRVWVVSQNQSVASWFSVVGETERDFAIEATQQFTLQINVPPDAPAGSYPFRLYMLDIESPDNNFAEGPSATFEVQAPGKTPLLWWLVAVLAILFLIFSVVVGGLVYYQGRPDTVATRIVQALQTDTATTFTAQAVIKPTPSVISTPTEISNSTPTNTATLAPTFSPTVAPAAARFEGTWLNDNLNTSISKLVITNNGDTMSVHGVGACSLTAGFRTVEPKGQTNINDDARLLTENDLKIINQASANTPYTVNIWTTANKYLDKHSFLSDVKRRLGANSVIIAIDITVKYTYVLAGQQTGLSSNDEDAASNATVSLFRTRQWGNGVVAGITSLNAAAANCDWGTWNGPFTSEPLNILFNFKGGLEHTFSISLSQPDKLKVVDVGSANGTKIYYFHIRPGVFQTLSPISYLTP